MDFYRFNVKIGIIYLKNKQLYLFLTEYFIFC